MLKSTWVNCFLLLAGCAVGRAQSVGGPVLGYYFDAAPNRIRTIAGIPGSAVLGNSLDLGIDLKQAYAAPASNYLLADLADDSGVVIVQPARAAGASSRALPGAAADADLVAFSPSGSAAALYFAASRRIQVFTGLPDAPTDPREVDTHSISAALSALAISNDGAALLAGVSDDAAAGLYLAGDSGFQLLSAAVSPSSIAFLHRGDHVTIADRGRASIFLLRNVRGAARLSLLANADAGIAEPIAAAPSADDGTVVAASASGSIWAIDVASGKTSAANCDCRPDRLRQLRGNAVFQLTGASDAAMMVFDGDFTTPRVVFIASSGTEGQ